MAESQADRNERPVCNCPTIAGEKVKFAYCPVHGASAAMDHLHALDAAAKAEPRVSTVLGRIGSDGPAAHAAADIRARTEAKRRLRELLDAHLSTPYCRTCERDFDAALAEFRGEL